MTLPLHRQKQRINRMGLDVAVSTLADQVTWGTDLLTPLWWAARRRMLAVDVLHLDGTGLPVLHNDEAQGGLVYGETADLSGPVPVRNDCAVRDVYGGDSFFFGLRSSINSVTSNTCPGGCAVENQGGLNLPEANGANIPGVRYTTTFPEVNGRREHRFGSMGGLATTP